MNRLVKLAASAALAAAGTLAADACTGVYVGRAVSEDGTTMICRTVDDWSMAFWHFGTVVPHKVSEPAIVYRGCYGFERTWPSETYRYVCTPRARQFRSGRFASLAMNEKGVAITGTVTAWPKHSLIDGDPFVKTGATEESVPEYLIACSASAREAVDNLAAIMRENGNAEGNIYMFADQQEAWYVETYSGHEWCAVRMPEDRMAAFGNEYMLGEIDPAADGVLVSPGLYSLIERTGSAVKGAGGRIHLAASCGARLIDFSNMRTWWGRRFFAPDSVGEYATDVRHEAFFKPSGKVSKADVFAFFRSRYEGTDLCPEANHLDYIKFVGTENQENEHVLSVRSDVPAEFAVTSWTAFGPADHSVFFPIPSALDRFEPEFGTDSPDGAEWGAKNEFSAANEIRRLATLARIDRVRYGEGVRAYWKDLETRYLREWPEVQAKAFSAGDRANAAAILSEYSRSCQREVDKAAKGLFGDLVQYMVTDVRTVHWHPSADGYGIEPIPRNPPFRPVRSDIFGVGQSAESPLGKAPLSAAAVTVLPKATDEALINPDMGFVYYKYSNRLWAYGINTENGDTLDWFPGCSTIYYRLLWNDLEPEEGVYRWDLIDSTAQNWISKGKRIAIRVICCNQTETATPQYVRDAGAKGEWFQYEDRVSGLLPPRWCPNYDDPVFVGKLEKFLRAMACRYDGNPGVALIDVGSYGIYGEGHHNGTHYARLRDENPAEFERLARLHLDLYRKCFPNTYLVVSDDIGGGGWLMDKDGNKIPDHPLFQYCRSLGIGLRDDSIMCSPPPDQWLSDHYARRFAPTMPVVLETGHFPSLVRKPGKYSVENYVGSIEAYQASYMSIHDFPKDHLRDYREAIDRINRIIGYRFELREVSYPEEVKAGEMFVIESKWVNVGVAPRTKENFLAWSLVNEDGSVAWTVTDDAFDFRSLEPRLKGVERPQAVKTTCRFGFAKKIPQPDQVVSWARDMGRSFPDVITMLKGGTYRLAVSVGRPDGTPEIALPLDGQIGATRRYEVGKIHVK